MPHGPGRGFLPELLVCPTQVFTKRLALDMMGKHKSQLQRDSLLHSALQSSTSESAPLINLCNAYTCFKTQNMQKCILQRASLMVQRMRIHLPMQGTWIRSLVRENSTRRGAAKPVCHRYGARTPAPSSCCTQANAPTLCNKRSRHREKPMHLS